MDYRRRGLVPVTCTYWRNATCFKGDRCTFVHGFICRDDGVCSDGSCNKAHFKQRDPCTYMKGRMKNSSRTRYRNSRSRSPYRRSRSPYSPRRRLGSPRRRSRSPRRSYSPRKSYSPRRSHSRTRSRTRSRSGTRSERSFTPKRDYSPYKKENRSISRSYSRSPRMVSKSPGRRKFSPSPQPLDSDESHSPVKEKNGHVYGKKGKDEPLIIKDNEDMFYDPNKEKEEPSEKLHKSKFKPIGEVEKESKKSQPDKTPEDLSPSSKALEILKTLPKDFFTSKVSQENKGSKDDESLMASDQDSFREAFLKALNENSQGSGSSSANKGTDKLPPVLKLPLNAESLAKPFQEKLYGIDQESNSSLGSSLWTPALERNKAAPSKSAMGAQSISSWEIDTPYVGRNSRGSSKELPPPTGKETMPPPSGPFVEESKKKKKRRRRTSSSTSSSSSEDDGANSESAEAALERKKKILSKVWTLMAQKKKLEAQRDETVLNHKGDGKSLAVLLKENSTLSAEIDKQIFLMNQMVQSINERLGMSKTEAQQQEFFFQPNMYKDSKTVQLHAKKNMTEKNLKKSISKFLKPTEESSKKHLSPSPVHKGKKSKVQSKSRSDSRERKVSPPTMEKKLVKKQAQEKKVKKETSPALEEVKHKKKKELKKQSSATKVKTQPKEELDEQGAEYAPSPAMKPHVKYIDQGMHWCRICNDFLDSVEEYVSHLESGSHLDKVKEDPKPWLPKMPKVEKEPVNPDAPVLTIPLQGMEFIHSITAYFCSLCNTFVKTKDEAKFHAETKLHVSKYKDYLSKNPMYEVTYVKDKMAAFAKYSVDKERRKEKNSNSENSKTQDFFGEVKNKTDEDIGNKLPSSLGREESFAKSFCKDELFCESVPEGNLFSPEELQRETSSDSIDEKGFNGRSSNGGNFLDNCQETVGKNAYLSNNNVSTNASSIRVASRISSSGASDEKSNREVKEKERSCSVSPKLSRTPVENSRRKRGSSSDDDERRTLSIEEEEKLHALKKRVAEFKGGPDTSSRCSPTQDSKNSPKNQTKKKSPSESSSSVRSSNREQSDLSHHQQQQQQQQSGSSKLHIKTYSNVIIGKMPFLKRSKPTSKSSETSKTQENESNSSFSEAEERIRQMLTEGFPSLPQTTSDNKGSEPLPALVPRNTEYITEIESCDDGTTFTKKFGPTLKPEDFSDEESKEAPMELSFEESDNENSIQDNSQSLMSIPVPTGLMKEMEWKAVSPVEKKLNVDLNSPHLSQLSAAAAMYKEAVSYQPIPIPPAPFMQIPAVPAMMNPPPLFPPFNPAPQPPIPYPDDYMEGANPPPPGTEEGSSNHSSGNQHSDGVGDSPDSFLCQKTPPPPGTEDEVLKITKLSKPTKVASNKRENIDGHSLFKEMLSDLPVMSHDNNTPKLSVEKDEGSQESLVQEGLELLEFADEDEEREEEKVHRNLSPPRSAAV